MKGQCFSANNWAFVDVYDTVTGAELVGDWVITSANSFSCTTFSCSMLPGGSFTDTTVSFNLCANHWLAVWAYDLATNSWAYGGNVFPYCLH